jgi:hypothetical protein
MGKGVGSRRAIRRSEGLLTRYLRIDLWRVFSSEVKMFLDFLGVRRGVSGIAARGEDRGS